MINVEKLTQSTMRHRSQSQSWCVQCILHSYKVHYQHL